MKNLKLLLVLCLVSLSCFADGIEGKWYGSANVGVMNLRIVFNIEKKGETFSGTMQSPDQSDIHLPISALKYEGNKLTIVISNIDFVYDGELKDGKIQGSFTQMGKSFPLELSRQAIVRARPQEVVSEPAYQSEEVSIINLKSEIKLAGTLTIPQQSGSCPAVILVSGSGPQNRDEELLGHKPFLVIANYLTQRGIAVLRYDDRGVGESQGDYASAGMDEFYSDAYAAVQYLKHRPDIDKTRIGVIGHSEGGSIALMLAARKEVAFAVTLAAPGVDGSTLMDMQREAIFRASDAPEEFITEYNKLMGEAQKLALRNDNIDKLREKITALFSGTSLQGETEKTVQQLSSAEIKSILAYDPRKDLQKIKCPVLALNGSNDLQVPAKANLQAISTGIASNGNQQVTTKEYPDLNHLFQTSSTGLPLEYGQIEETFNQKVLEDMAAWILAR